MRKTGKLTISVLVVLIVCLLGGVNTYALEVPDPDAKGSISVTLKDPSTKKAVTSGTLAIFKVGEMYEDNGNYGWNLTKEFAGSKADLTKIDSESLAVTLALYVAANASKNPPAATADLDKNGTAVFSNLGVGLYLIVQTKNSTGYKKAMPFLVSVPMKNEKDGTWIYEVDASPKVELEKATPTPNPTITPRPPVTQRPKVTTVVKKSVLPKTGQLWWPVGILAVVGVVLIFVGIRRRSEK